MIEAVAFVGGVILGVVIGIFFYRNNESKIDPIADKVDDIKDNVEGIKDDVKNLKK